MGGVDETRGNERIPTAIPVSFKIHDSMKGTLPFGEKRMSSHITDIAVSGCALLSYVFIPKNVLLEIEIDGASVYNDGNPHVIKVSGRVMNSRNISKDSYRLGISFENISADDQKVIKDFVLATDRRNERRVQLNPPEKETGS